MKRITIEYNEKAEKEGVEEQITKLLQIVFKGDYTVTMEGKNGSDNK